MRQMKVLRMPEGTDMKRDRMEWMMAVVVTTFLGQVAWSLGQFWTWLSALLLGAAIGRLWLRWDLRRAQNADSTKGQA